MKLRYRIPIVTPETRKALVDLLSATIQGRPRDSFEPYCPNEHDDTYWTLDSANDWKVCFPGSLSSGPNSDDLCVFEVRYRYEQGTPKEAALAGWLVARIGAEVVT